MMEGSMLGRYLSRSEGCWVPGGKSICLIVNGEHFEAIRLSSLPTTSCLQSFSDWAAIIWTTSCLLYLFREATVMWLSSKFHFLHTFVEMAPSMVDWRSPFSHSFLRALSFALDYHWSTTAGPEAKQTGGSVVFGGWRYVTYMFFPPIMVDGPVMTFEDFSHQMGNMKAKTSPGQVLKYGARVMLAGLFLEILLHVLYVDVISASGVWRELVYSEFPKTSVSRTGEITMGPFGILTLMFWGICLFYLKRLVLWRYFRFWSMLAGVTPAEDMQKCVFNHHSIQAFGLVFSLIKHWSWRGEVIRLLLSSLLMLMMLSANLAMFVGDFQSSSEFLKIILGYRSFLAPLSVMMVSAVYVSAYLNKD
ncbi:hypothetical protein BSKO_06349 [Bryopsis sp. KO-2023]|nr:hypothetical protein BSKO_06349 [Bryopsis sp. KO-2023]